jgi:hypothetical protein
MIVSNLSQIYAILHETVQSAFNLTCQFNHRLAHPTIWAHISQKGPFQVLDALGREISDCLIYRI